jgi:hypothetical protein
MSRHDRTITDASADINAILADLEGVGQFMDNLSEEDWGAAMLIYHASATKAESLAGKIQKLKDQIDSLPIAYAKYYEQNVDGSSD